MPVVAVAACLFILGGIAAWSILWQQSDLAEVYRENLTSRRVAIELDELRLSADAEVRRMEGSLQTFLDYARPQKVEPQQMPIDPLLRRVFDLLRPRAERQSVNVEIGGSAGVEVYGDPGAIHQVMSNLGLNALDAMPGGGTIRTDVRR